MTSLFNLDRRRRGLEAQRPRLPLQAFGAALLLSILIVAPCRAERPLTTEDADVKAARECELGSYYARQSRLGIAARHLEFGCGVGFDSELGLVVSRERSPESAADFVTLEGKTGLRAASKDAPGFAVAYSFNSEQDGRRLKRPATEIKAVASWIFPDYRVHGNVGWIRDPSSHLSRATWGLAAERLNAMSAVDLAAEVFGDGAGSPWVQFGFRWALVPDRLVFDASWGLRTDSSDSRIVTIGLKASL